MMHCGRASGDDALLELDDLLAAGLVLARAVGDFDFEMVRVEEVAVTAHALQPSLRLTSAALKSASSRLA